MKITPSEIVSGYIMFPPRMEAGLVSFDRENKPGRLHPEGDLYQFHLARRFRSIRTDDLRSLTRDAFAGLRSLRDFYLATMCHAGIDVVFRDAAPRIGHSHFTAWRGLHSSLDPDALLTASFVTQLGRVPTTRDLRNWGVHALYDDRELERLFVTEHFSDIHVHMGGCEPASILWLELMWGRLRYTAFREYRKYLGDQLARGGGPPDCDSMRELDEEIGWIEAAREWAQSWLGKRPDTLDQAPDGFPSALARALWAERQALCRAWMQPENKTETQRLDQYLFAKTRFLLRHQQFAGSNPGLDNFRHYFDRPKPDEPEPSVRVRHERMLRWIAPSTENPALHRIEFRISPYDTVGGYARFFRDWNKHFGRSRSLAAFKKRIRFVIHFIRERDGGPELDRIPHARLRRRIDRQSAALHLFRLKYQDHRGDQALHRLITGIDVANYERQCPVDVFSPYLRMLRGIFDERTPENIRESLDSEYASHWRQILDNGTFLAPNLRRLGLTYHAGEDYFHPLDGMRAISHAIKFCRMQPGDRIGHGLAAGTDIRRFTEEYQRILTLPRGEVLDSFAWLHRMLSTLPGYEPELRRIEAYLDQLSWQIYGRIVPVSVICELKQMRHEFPDVVRRRLSTIPAELWEQELSWEIREARAAMISMPDLYSSLTDAIIAVQRHLVAQAVRANVIFEINPSSNLATSAMSDLCDHPFFQIHQYARDSQASIRVTVNTDDPGLFATRPENEYALMLEALQRRFGKDGREPYELIRQMLEWSREASFEEDDEAGPQWEHDPGIRRYRWLGHGRNWPPRGK